MEGQKPGTLRSFPSYFGSSPLYPRPRPAQSSFRTVNSSSALTAYELTREFPAPDRIYSDLIPEVLQMPSLSQKF